MHTEKKDHDSPIFAVPDAPRVTPPDSLAPYVATRCDSTLDFFLSVRFVLPFIVLTMVGTMAGVTIALLSSNTTEAVGEVVVIMQNSVLETLEARVSATLGALVAENTRFASEVAEFGIEPPPPNATRVSPKDFRYAVSMARALALSPVIDNQVMRFPAGKGFPDGRSVGVAQMPPLCLPGSPCVLDTSPFHLWVYDARGMVNVWAFTPEAVLALDVNGPPLYKFP